MAGSRTRLLKCGRNYQRMPPIDQSTAATRECPPCANANLCSLLGQQPQSWRVSEDVCNLTLESLGRESQDECGCGGSQVTSEASTEAKVFCLTAVDK